MGERPDMAEILDGLALWDEHKPQSGEDWRAVARRCLDDPSGLNPSPLFAGLLSAEARVRELEEGLQELTHAVEPFIDEGALGSFQFGEWVPAEECDVTVTNADMQRVADEFARARSLLEGETPDG